MDTVLLDLDGVIYQGDSALPGALATLKWLRQENIPHLFLTNTTSRPASAVISKLNAMDIEIDPDQLLTPVIVARHWLKQNAAKRVACLIAEQSLEDLSGLELLAYPDQAKVDAVIVGDLAGD
jgi:phospholysine phosphohistidine inorganic pyrophosphate phosphatase